MRRERVLGLAATLLLAFSGHSLAASAQILQYSSTPDGTAALDRVSVNREILEFPEGVVTSLTLPTGATVDVEIKRIRQRQTTSSFIGKVVSAGIQGSVTLTFDSKFVFGRIVLAPNAWELKANSDGTVALIDEATRPRLMSSGHDTVTVDTSTMEPPMPDAAGPSKAQAASALSRNRTAEVSILMLYSEDFEDEYPAVTTKLQQLLDVVNTGLVNSDVDAELVLAGTRKIAQPVSESTGDVLDKMRKGEGLYSRVDIWRTKYNADLVSMVRGRHPGRRIDSHCGWGMVPQYEQGKLVRSAAAYTGGHDRDTGCRGLDKWSCGYKVAASFKTYMSYGYEAQAGVYSSPKLTGCGPSGSFACGNAQTADNAKTFRKTASVLASYAPGRIEVWHPYAGAVVSRGVDHRMYFSREMHVGETLRVDLVKDGDVVANLGTYRESYKSSLAEICSTSSCKYRPAWYTSNYIGARCDGWPGCQKIYAKRFIFNVPTTVPEGRGYSIRITNPVKPAEYVWHSQAFKVAGPGIIVTPKTDISLEEKSREKIEVRLSAPPFDTVSFTVKSSDTSEMTVSKSSLKFTHSNWNTPQTVTLKGIDDSIKDGDRWASVVFGKATSGSGRVYWNQALPSLRVNVLDKVIPPSPEDPDADGMTTVEETFWGGNPLQADADSDRDGIPDVIDSDRYSNIDSGRAQRLEPGVTYNEILGHRTPTGGEHFSVVRYGFESRYGNDDLTLQVRGWNVASDTGVKVTLNGTELGYLREGEPRQQGKKTLFQLPRNLLRSGLNTIDIRNVSSEKRWGVYSISLKPLATRTIELKQGKRDNNEYGHRYGDSAHLAFARFSVIPSSWNVTLSMKGYDIDTEREVGVYVNDEFRGHLPMTPNNAVGSKYSVRVPVTPGRSNLIEVRQMSRTLGEKWGVTRVLVTE